VRVVRLPPRLAGLVDHRHHPERGGHPGPVGPRPRDRLNHRAQRNKEASMSVAVEEDRASIWAGGWAPPWWLFLVTGISWLILALLVLRFDIPSVTTVGILLGVVLIGAGLTELVAVPGRSLRWAHVLLGILFLVGGTWALFSPRNAFWELASILG